MNEIDKSLVAYHQKFSLATEAYRGLRTNLLLLKSKKKDGPLIFVVTSARSGEGKSTTAANISVLLAQAKHRTLLVDADLRKPKIHEIFGLKASDGLISILEGKKTFRECVIHSDIKELDILVCDYRELDPTELLSDKSLNRFINEVSSNYDYIILDSPPICLLTDTSLIAAQINNVLFVVSEGVASGNDLKKAKRNLDNVDANILGVVYNRAETQESSYGYYYTGNKNTNKIQTILLKIKDVLKKRLKRM